MKCYQCSSLNEFLITRTVKHVLNTGSSIAPSAPIYLNFTHLWLDSLAKIAPPLPVAWNLVMMSPSPADTSQ